MSLQNPGPDGNKMSGHQPAAQFADHDPTQAAGCANDLTRIQLNVTIALQHKAYS